MARAPIPGWVRLTLTSRALVALSDGSLIEAPRSYRKAEDKLRKLHRHVSRRRRALTTGGRLGFG